MYLQQFPEANVNLNQFIQKDTLQIQCTYIPPIAILHRAEQKVHFSDVMNLLQIYQTYNSKDFRMKTINFDNRTYYVTVHDEKKCILKDGDDNAMIILPSHNIITVGIIDRFSTNKKQFMTTLLLFDKLKNENYKSLFL